MSNLEKRIAALEATTATTDDMTIIRRYVSPGHVDSEVYSLRDDAGTLWTRQSDESEQELIDRATREVKRNPRGFACLSGHAGKRPYGNH